MKKTIIKPLILATAVASSPMIATSAAQAASVSGNIGVHSQYILRGVTNAPENDDAAVQGGFDVGFDNGLYLGYWGSSLGYGTNQNGFENDVYGGYAGSIGDFSYDLGVVQYYYINIDDADGTEAYASAGYGPFSVGAKTLLNDVVWGNQGDTYWTASFTQPLPKGFTFDATAGFYTYENSGEYEPSLGTTEDSGFRHLNLSLSHPIGNTGADMGVTYVIGGETRDGTDQDNAIFFSLTYGFDIM